MSTAQDLSTRCEVAIMGGGLAGLCAAIRALELGRSVIVFERGESPDYACNTRYCGGLMHVAFKDMAAPAAAIEATIAAGHTSEPELRHSQLLARECGRALEWLCAQGARFEVGGEPEFMRWMMAPTRPRTAGLAWRGYGPDRLLQTMAAKLSAAGGTVRTGSRIAGLEYASEAGFRLRVECDGVVQMFRANAVVIADGGFQADPDLVREFICAAPEKLLQRGAATGRGDGLRLARSLGAAVVGVERFYGHLLGREAFDNERLWPYPIVDNIAAAGVVVGPDGRRFMDEGRGGVYMANTVARLADPLSTTVVFDDAVWNGLAADNRYPPCMNPVFTEAGGTVLEADTLTALAHEAGLDSQGLCETVSAHNALVRDSQPASPHRSVERFAPHALSEPPFRAIHLCAGITYTMGGIAIDEWCRVLGRDGAPLPGLYAAGSASGGMEGGEGAVYLGGLAKALVTGIRAAEHISRTDRGTSQFEQPGPIEEIRS